MLRGARVTLVAAMTAIAFAGATSTADAFQARGSVEQVYVTGAKTGVRLALFNKNGKRVARKRADAQGGLLFRNVKPGKGYRVRRSGGGEQSGPLTVLTKRPAPPSKNLYDQDIPDEGYGYLTTRDGTKLAYYVHPPEDVAKALPGGIAPPPVPDGPTPTLIEYSGYGYANPAGPQSGISVLANLMGFTVVDVNMRGTGCSGGAFDFFEPLQNLDGYDLVETVARQPWVKHGKVGMMGISYGGISQLFTAQLRPPSLAAISPLSVIDQVQTTLYPGGILNTGFAVEWAKQRQEEARPAGPDSGQEWAYQRIQEGDETCKANQALHGQAAQLMRKVRANDHYRAKVADPLSPITFVNKINVPTFMACQWQDEQTGGHCPTLASRFTSTKKKWFTFTNGTHVDSLDPEIFNRWYDFLKIYVARDTPATNSAHVKAAGPVIYEEAMGISGVTMPNDPIQQQPTYELAKAAFEAQPPVRILFDNGAGGSEPGQPLPGYERSFARFPIPGTTGRSFYLRGGGKLGSAPAAQGGADAFKWDPHARTLTNFKGDTAGGEGGLWTATPPYKWMRQPAGSGVSYLSGPLGSDTTVVGAGFVRAWVRSSRPSVDLQATITEVRPDGREVFVQSGWLRANERKLDAKKNEPLRPVLSLRERDVKPMPKGRFAKLTIPLYYQGHAYRAGSRVRLKITAPGGDQPIWAFEEHLPKDHDANVAVARSGKRPSRLVLPVVPAGDIPTELPPCPGLRGQPCRNYKPFANRAATR
jgi:predicted acyl esterase